MDLGATLITTSRAPMARDRVLPVATVQAAGRPTTPSPRPKGIGKSARGPPGGSSGGMARSPVVWKAQTIRGVARPEAILLTGANAPMRPSPLAAHPAALLLQAQIVRQQVQDQEQPGAATEAPRPQPSPSPQAPPQRSPSPPQTTSPEPPSASPPAPPQAPPPRPQPAPDPPPVAAPSGAHQQPRSHHAAASQLPNLPQDFADAKVRIGPLRPPLDPTAKTKRQPEPVPAVVHTPTASLLGDDLKALPGGTATGRIGARLSVKQHLTCKQYSDEHGYTDQSTGERPLCQSCQCARIAGERCALYRARLLNLSFNVTCCCCWKSFSLCRRRAASPPHPHACVRVPPRARARQNDEF